MDGCLLLGAPVLLRELNLVGVSYAVLAFLTLACTGMHRRRINPRLGDDLPPLLGRLATAFTVLAVLSANAPQALVSLARVAPAGMLLVSVGRALSYAAIRGARMRSRGGEPTLIIGAGKVGAQLASVLRAHPEFGMVPIGFLDSFQETRLSIPVLGDVQGLASTVERYRVTKVIVAFGAMGSSEMVRVLRDCDRLPVQVFVVPRFFELGVDGAGSVAEDVWGIPLIPLRRPALQATAQLSKRIVDVTLATLGLVLISPLLLATAVSVRCSSPGPVLFRQKRVGRNGQVFEVLKFRTLEVNDDSDMTWSVVADHRLTRVGSALRRTGLDELPQLINVLRGEMSLIGPRPERAHFANRFSVEVPHYDDRHRVLGGITGWAQVHGLRGDTPISERARFDNHYIEHWSLWRDVVIFARTLARLLLLR